MTKISGSDLKKATPANAAQCYHEAYSDVSFQCLKIFIHQLSD
jgi:hypothetical protein